jgi:hypothetical protein
MKNVLNFKRIILGGLITGMILNLIDTPNGMFIAGPQIKLFLAEHAVPYNPLIPAYFFPYHLILGMMMVWTYAAIIPQFGAGRKAALYATILLLITTRMMAFGFVVMGLLPLHLYLILSATMVIGSLVGGLTGCWYYSRGSK